MQICAQICTYFSRKMYEQRHWFLPAFASVLWLQFRLRLSCNFLYTSGQLISPNVCFCCNSLGNCPFSSDSNVVGDFNSQTVSVLTPIIFFLVTRISLIQVMLNIFSLQHFFLYRRISCLRMFSALNWPTFIYYMANKANAHQAFSAPVVCFYKQVT